MPPHLPGNQAILRSDPSRRAIERVTRRIYFRWRSFARIVAPHMIAQGRTRRKARLESERIRERLLLEFRGQL